MACIMAPSSIVVKFCAKSVPHNWTLHSCEAFAVLKLLAVVVVRSFVVKSQKIHKSRNPKKNWKSEKHQIFWSFWRKQKSGSSFENLKSPQKIVQKLSRYFRYSGGGRDEHLLISLLHIGEKVHIFWIYTSKRRG